MPYVDPTALQKRALKLAAQSTLSGMQQVRVTLDGTTTPPQAYLDVRFWNANLLAQILADPAKPTAIFPILGGHRLRAGAAAGMVQVTAIAASAAPDTLRLTVAPIGDYSTYTVTLAYANVDPLFASLDFKFRPGCFSIDCATDWVPPPAPLPEPRVDMLARDYDSLRHALIGAMQRRVPGWQPTSDADLSVTLLDLFAAVGDELADYQDRVMNEAYLATARNRVSLARHARLVDYQIHQGNQASTILAMRVVVDQPNVPFGLAVATDDPDAAAGTTFITVEQGPMLTALNDISLYTWDDTRATLVVGDTSADLAFTSVPLANAAIAQWTTPAPATKAGDAPYAPPRLLIAEQLNPITGGIADRNPDKRQILNVTGAVLVTDPMNPAQVIVRIMWSADDALASDYCFIEVPATGPVVRDICRFHGNLVAATSGAPASATFRLPSPTQPLQPGGLAAIPTARWGTLCPLPTDRPLLYLDTPPDGITAPVSSLAVVVVDPDGHPDVYEERINLVHSQAGDRHFMVETDELLRSTIRFGNGKNGEELDPGSQIQASWRTGLGLDGNVGRDRLVVCKDARIASVWNPFDATSGRAPERTDEIRRNAPEAFRARQLRAVTLADYVARAEEVPGVQRAAAAYLWTGSWRTVRVTIDPAGSDVLSMELAAAVEDHLEVLRLIGEDLEIRAPIYVPLRVELVVCVRSDVWPEDLRPVIEKELSDGWTDDGRLALFNPDNWTFGQPLYESELAGRLQRIDGVEHIARLSIQRWDAPTPGDGRHVEVGPSEIIQVHNDPDHMELGFIELELAGGRQ